MDTIKEAVQQKYGEAAVQARSGAKAGCGCGTSCCSDPITSNLYDEAQAAGVPAEALLASLGCGNPTALAELKAGEVVLDLGSGGGIDVLLSAKRVGPTRLADSSTSMPPPDPRSRTTSPAFSSASAVGLPQPSDASTAADGSTSVSPLT